MGNMHVIPTEADLRTAEEKCEPIKGFKPLTDKDSEWEHGAVFCPVCNEPFDFVFVRKHHCHVCGRTHCSRCAPKRHILSKARGCGKCTSKLMLQMKEGLLEDHLGPSSPQIKNRKAKAFPAAEKGNEEAKPADAHEVVASNPEPQRRDSPVSDDAEAPSPKNAE